MVWHKSSRKEATIFVCKRGISATGGGKSEQQLSFLDAHIASVIGNTALPNQKQTTNA